MVKCHCIVHTQVSAKKQSMLRVARWLDCLLWNVGTNQGRSPVPALMDPITGRLLLLSTLHTAAFHRDRSHSHRVELSQICCPEPPPSQLRPLVVVRHHEKCCDGARASQFGH